MDDGVVTQDEIFENIKLHKEVLGNVKMQPWNMRKKLKLVVQAKTYIKKHEGALQERLAQSRSTRDMLARWNIYLIKVSQCEVLGRTERGFSEVAALPPRTGQFVQLAGAVGAQDKGDRVALRLGGGVVFSFFEVAVLG